MLLTQVLGYINVRPNWTKPVLCPGLDVDRGQIRDCNLHSQERPSSDPQSGHPRVQACKSSPDFLFQPSFLNRSYLALLKWFINPPTLRLSNKVPCTRNYILFSPLPKQALDPKTKRLTSLSAGEMSKALQVANLSLCYSRYFNGAQIFLETLKSMKKTYAFCFGK